MCNTVSDFERRFIVGILDGREISQEVHELLVLFSTRQIG